MTARFPHVRDPLAFTERLESLFRRVEAHPDAAVRELMLDLAWAVMHLHHEGLFRITTLLRNVAGGDEVLAVLRGDPIVGALLADHGLLEPPPRPEDMDRRVRATLDRVRPYMHGHGGDVDLLEVRDGIARLRLQGACHGCASSTLTLKMGVERLLKEAVPELTGIEVEGLPTAPPGVIPLDAIGRGGGRWHVVARADGLAFGTRPVTVDGSSLLLCAAFGRVYAVRDRCPLGGGTLRGAALEAFLLVCPCHGERFDLRSGRGVRRADVRLELLPVVVDAGEIRVAVG